MIITKDREFWRGLLRLSIPLTLGNLINFLITLCDNLMIGRLGENATSGVYAGTVINSVLIMLIAGIEGGILVGAVQHRGKGEHAKASGIAILGTGVILAISLCAMTAALLAPKFLISLFLRGESAEGGTEYLRALAPSFPLTALASALATTSKSIELPKLSVTASVFSFAVNFALNYLLIFGNFGFPKLGAVGSAVATAAAKGTECAVLAALLIFTRSRRSAHRKSGCGFAIGVKDFGAFIGYTMPIFLGQLIWIVNTLFSTWLIGKLNTGADFAGFAIANTLNALTYIIPNALSAAVGITVGKAVGGSQMKKLREYTYTSELLFFLLGLITAAVLQIVKAPFISFYNVSEEAKGSASELINVLSLTTVATAYSNALLSGIVKSGGDVSFILKNDAIFIFIFVIPISLAAYSLSAPLWLIFLCLKSDQILKCIPAAIRIHSFKWINDLTDG